jgi:hypothetical protein
MSRRARFRPRSNYAAGAAKADSWIENPVLGGGWSVALGTATMFNGSVDLRAETHGAGLEFSPLNFDPKHSNVDRISIEAPPGGREIKSTAHLKSVATEEDGKAIRLPRRYGAVRSRANTSSW